MQYLVELVGEGGEPNPNTTDSAVVSNQPVEEVFSSEFNIRCRNLGERLVGFVLVRPGVIIAVFED